MMESTFSAAGKWAGRQKDVLSADRVAVFVHSTNGVEELRVESAHVAANAVASLADHAAAWASTRDWMSLSAFTDAAWGAKAPERLVDPTIGGHGRRHRRRPERTGELQPADGTVGG